MAFILRAAAVKAARGGASQDTARPQLDPELRDLKEASKDLEKLAGEMPHVAVRALNKAMTGVKTDMVSLVRERYNLKASAIRKRISINRANLARIEGHIESKGQAMHLTDVAGTRQTKKGVMVNVKKDTGRKLIPSAFIQRGQYSGKKIVLIRTDDPGKDRRTTPPGRYPVEAKNTVDPEHLYNAPDNWARLSQDAAKRIDENVEREIDAEFRRQQGKW